MELIMKDLLKYFTAVFFLTFAGYSFAANNHDTCTELPGTWVGKAQLKYFIFTCEYDSVAAVNEGSPNTAEVEITRTSSNILCPKNGTQTVDVLCDNGRVEMKDAVIDVAGNLSDDGHRAELQGSLYAMFRYHPFKLSVEKSS